jgi:AraC-like DNA-binding protein
LRFGSGTGKNTARMAMSGVALKNFPRSASSPAALRLSVVTQCAPHEFRTIHGSVRQDTPIPRTLTVFVRHDDRTLTGAVAWVGRGWLHIDAVARHLPGGTATIKRLLTTLETEAAHQGCRSSQMELTRGTLQTILEQHGYSPVQSFDGTSTDWIVLRKELALPGGAARFAGVRSVMDAQKGRLSASDAAALLHLSTSRFRHEFKASQGVSFRVARLDAKLAYAVHLLRTTTLTIPEIATALGYSDRSKLERAFKRAFGLTPTQYRKDC